MALSHSTGLKNFILDSGIATAFDGGTGRINIYSGSQPANAGLAATGTLLGTLTLNSDSFAAAASGAIAMNSITADSSADATATAGYFRVYRTGDTAPGSAAVTADRRLDGSITATGGGGDMTFDSVSFTIGGTVSITSFTYNHPA